MGYRYDIPATEYLLAQGDKDSVWRKDKDPKEVNGILFFVKESIPSEQEIINGWSLADAEMKTLIDAQTDIAHRISVDIKAMIEDITGIDRNNDDIKQLEKFNISVYSESSASFSGLQPGKIYYEVYLRRNKNKAVSYVHYWVQYSIPLDEINKAIEDIRTGKSIEAKERAVFEHLKTLHADTVAALKDCELFSKEDEQRYTILYHTLLDTNGRLHNLPTLAGIKDYNDEREAIKKDVQDYDPTNMLLKKNKWLTEKWEKLQSEYLILEREKNAVAQTINLYTALVLSQLPKQNNSNSSQKELERIDFKIQQLQPQIASIYNAITPIAQTMDSIKHDMERLHQEEISQTLIIVPVRKQEYSVSLSSGNILSSYSMVTNREYLLFISVEEDSDKRTYSRSKDWLNSAACSVSWIDAVSYCNQLSRIFGYQECYTDKGDNIFQFDNRKNGYRLPTKEEITELIDKNYLSDTTVVQYGLWLSDTGHNTVSKPVYRRPHIQAGESFINNKPITGDDSIGFMVIRNAQ
jgi:hypothetical protein